MPGGMTDVSLRLHVIRRRMKPLRVRLRRSLALHDVRAVAGLRVIPRGFWRGIHSVVAA